MEGVVVVKGVGGRVDKFFCKVVKGLLGRESGSVKMDDIVEG